MHASKKKAEKKKNGHAFLYGKAIGCKTKALNEKLTF
jgi:hypothetical protein